MTLELCEADESGELVEGGLYPAATIVADENEKQWLELYPEGELVRIPLTEFEEAIAQAKEGVHGEKFYDSHDSTEADT
jgi:hypothetical protein